MCNNATVDRDIWVYGNQYFYKGTLFGSEIDIDYTKITTSLTVPRLTTDNAIVNTLLTAPPSDVLQTLNAGTMTSSQLNTNYCEVNNSLSASIVTSNTMLTSLMLICGNTSLSATGENFFLDVRNPNTYIFFAYRGLMSRRSHCEINCF